MVFLKVTERKLGKNCKQIPKIFKNLYFTRDIYYGVLWV